VFYWGTRHERPNALQGILDIFKSYKAHCLLYFLIKKPASIT
jgi:hypothetical protein